MENNKLISMTDFILNHPAIHDYQWQLKNYLNYANFLKQPLTIGMFVPCDEDGSMLNEPKKEDYSQEELKSSVMGCDFIDYEKAKENVLFESVDLSFDKYHYTKRSFVDIKGKRIYHKLEFHSGQIKEVWSIDCIEQLLGLDITLSQTAINQIYG